MRYINFVYPLNQLHCLRHGEGAYSPRGCLQKTALPALADAFHAETGAVEIDALFPPGNQQFHQSNWRVAGRVETPGGEMGEYLEASITVFVDLELFADSGEVGFGLSELTLRHECHGR